MLKFIKRLSQLIIILLICGGIWGYNNGMTKDNYKEFISDTISKFTPKPSIVKTEESPKEKKKLPKTKSQSKSKKKEKKEEKYVLQPLPKNPFYSIDRHSKNSPTSVEISIPSLANYLQQSSNTDLEKARAIYIWIIDNIQYDDKAFNSGIYPDYTAEYVLQNRKAVCDGFSNLYNALGKEMGLEIEKVVGYAKGYGYRVGSKLSQTDHAWNIIKINGQWKIFDSTWGRGHGRNVDGKLVSTKEFNDYWFNVNPFESIFNHFPENGESSFVNPNISLSQYERMPNIDEEYFELGFNGKETFLEVLSNTNFKAPESYRLKTPLTIEYAPKSKSITQNQEYDFQFYIPRAYEVAIIDSGNNWTYFERNKGKFNLKYSPTKSGKLQIGVKHEKSGESFETVLVYEVNRNRESI